MNFSKEKLSGSTNGKPIKVAASATPGTTVHTAQAGTAGWDLLFLYASNTSASAVTVTVEFGGTTDPDDLLVKSYSIPANSAPTPIAAGQILQNALVCKVYASTPNVITVSGWVDRIS